MDSASNPAPSTPPPGRTPPIWPLRVRCTDRGTPRDRTLRRLGSIPVNGAPLLELLRAPDDDPEAVTAALRRCPALAARVLSVTNSAAFGVVRPIEDIRRATLHLGPARTRAVALAFALRSVHENTLLPLDWTTRLWVNSLCKATSAELAARQIVPDRTDAAYAAGLIQDLGLPALMAIDPDFYESFEPGPRGSWPELERQHFGIDHAEVGAWLLQRWSAPDSLVQCVAHHHRVPGTDQSPDRPPDPQHLPLFIASLVPHFQEELTPAQRDWLVALHGQFLADRYPTPEAFFEAAAAAAAPLHKSAPAIQPTELLGQLVEEVTGSTTTLVHRLCDLEATLHRQREDIHALRFQALTDPLTQILNRRGFAQLGQRHLEDARRLGLGVGCLVIDLDNFKTVNDRHGHDAGDRMLRQIAQLLRDNVGRHDLVARYGGDEFALLITHVTASETRTVAGRLLDLCISAGALQEMAGDEGGGVSIGAVYAQPSEDRVGLDTLLQQADDAMYQRKHAGKRGLIFHDRTAADPAEA